MTKQQNYIIVKGARENNLKNIDIKIPRGKMVVMTGLSGSGKTSLAFDTIYAEGQRRYVESLSAYARQFLGNMDKPDVDSIEGLSPAISIDQKTTNKNPRSTVGTVTEIYDYLRLLYARIGHPICPEHHVEIQSQSIEQIVNRLLELPTSTRIQVLAPFASGKKGTFKNELETLRKEGYVRARIDGELHDLDESIILDKNKKHNIEIIVDRIVIKENITSRLFDSVETALKLGNGKVIIDVIGQEEMLFSEKFACPYCDFTIGDLEPRLFSFNSPFGACEECSGLGFKRKISVNMLVPDDSLSLTEGAIRGLDNVDSYFFQQLATTCEHYNIDINKPFRDLSQEEKDIIFYGSKEPLTFTFVSEGNIHHEKKSYFEGVITNYERRYKNTSSRYIQEWFESMMADEPCPKCFGKRLSDKALSVYVGQKNIYEFTEMSVEEALEYVKNLSLTPKEQQIAHLILKEIRQRLQFLVNVGLNYLALNRSAGTLSGGEAQRIRLATQIGSQLTGVLYVLDEPSIGLHQRDNQRLINSLKAMRDLGNTLIIVEHDEETMLESDYLIDIGPGAGTHGGEVVAYGTPEEVMNNSNSLTGKYLKGELSIPIPKQRRKGNGLYIEVINARENNLKNLNVKFPLGKMIVVTGVSGSGKSTLVNDILYRGIANYLYKTNIKPGLHDRIEGLENIEKIIDIDQSPIGRTPRSNPATYTGVFDHIRDLFAETAEAKIRGYQKGRFSFNVKGGRCETCRGDGVIRIEMHFLPDVYVPCEVCHGKRYNRETLEVKYKGKNIADVLDMTVEEALNFFENIPIIQRKIQTMYDVGLGYIKLGQPATTLSGGEAQRVKLASELHKRTTDKTLYILDEPTTGLHVDDVKRLLEVLNNIVDQNGTVIIIEHNLDVIKCADYIIDLGPEGGDKGGQIIACGTPEEVSEVKTSYTGQFIKKVLEKEKNRNIKEL
ncbi:MAG TPA: excinuclease ABC subunit UvrA [Haloplasmataceae bacterium]